MQRGALIYESPLSTLERLSSFVLEGQAHLAIHEGTLRLSSVVDESKGQAANYVLWCPEEFPADLWIEWDFWPETARGLCMFFFCARGRNGEDLFHPGLPKRTGEYEQYNRGAIDAYHISYYRRRDNGPLNLCNLRKSYGFHLVATAADPLRTPEYATSPYRLRVSKLGPRIEFWIEDLLILG